MSLELRNHLIPSSAPVKSALQQLDKLGGKNEQTLFVVDKEQRLQGALTDGDVRRGFLNGYGLQSPISDIMKKDALLLKEGQHSLEQVKHAQEKLIEILPLVNAQHQVVKIFNLSQYKSILPADAVIMAGGKGTRLRPLTNHTPKPLLKIGGKPIIEYNIDLLKSYGIQNINISVRYLGEQLEKAYGDGRRKGVNIKYAWEKEPLGTIGALSLVPEFKHDSILLMNSDLLTNMDLEKFFTEFEERDACMSVATVPYKVPVPYGILECEGDTVTALREKPTYTYQANAGVYLLKRDVVADIPRNVHYNATDLMKRLIANGRKLTYFPILDYWLDVGKHEDFQKAQEDVKHLKF